MATVLSFTAPPTSRPFAATAAKALTNEALRHPGPKTVLLLGHDDRVTATVLGKLMPNDRAVIWVSDPAAAAALTGQVLLRWPRVSGRVDVVDSAPDAKADVAIVASTADDELIALGRSLLKPNGVLSVAVPARPQRRDVLDAHAVRTELIVRGRVPVKVVHLRFDTAEPALAERLAPLESPSHVPVTRRMGLDSNGVAAAGILAGAAALTKVLRPRSKAWLLPAALAVPVGLFFRDPRRITPDDARAVIAAADGVVLKVDRVTDERFGPGDWLRIAVFLSVLDVHVNRSPVAGRVVEIIKEKGGYSMAQSAAGEHNVTQYTVLETTRGRAVVAQKTGLIARRIVNRAKIGAVLAKGERYGLIRFGSRTDVFLPVDSAEPAVGVGERVVGGETVIARYTN